MGELGDMFQFASLAENNWNEAVRLFTSPEFYRAFLEREPMYAEVYNSLTQSLSASQAMEEFLTYTHKKRSISLEVPERRKQIAYREEAEKHSLQLVRNTWGYLNAEVTSDVRFIKPLKHYISMEDFIGNKYNLEYMVFPEYMDRDSNLGHIMIETAYQKIVVEIDRKSVV